MIPRELLTVLRLCLLLILILIPIVVLILIVLILIVVILGLIPVVGLVLHGMILSLSAVRYISCLRGTVTVWTDHRRIMQKTEDQSRIMEVYSICSEISPVAEARVAIQMPPMARSRNQKPSVRIW